MICLLQFTIYQVFSKIQFSNLPISQLTMLWVFVCWLTSFPMTTGQRLSCDRVKCVSQVSAVSGVTSMGIIMSGDRRHMSQESRESCVNMASLFISHPAEDSLSQVVILSHCCHTINFLHLWREHKMLINFKTTCLCLMITAKINLMAARIMIH